MTPTPGNAPRRTRLHATPPGVLAAIAAVIGSTVGVTLGPSIASLGVQAWTVAAAAAVVATLATFVRPQRAMYTAALCLLFAALALGRTHELPADSLARLLTDQPTLLTVQGEVLDVPPEREADLGSLGDHAPSWLPTRGAPITIRVTHVGQHPDRAAASGILSIRPDAALERDLKPGDTVTAVGFARALQPPSNRGEMDWRVWNRSRGVVGTMTASNITPAVQPSDATPHAHPGVRARIASVRAAALDRIDAAAGDNAPLLRALLLGERSGPDYRAASDRFASAGVGHLLAISGLHVGIALAGVALLVRLTGDRPRIEFALVLLAAAALTVLIPARPPVVRAVILVLALLLARATGSRTRAIGPLGLACAAVLLLWPADAASPGFQLTFGVVAALVLLNDRVRAALFPSSPAPVRGDATGAQAAAAWARSAFAAGVVAWIVSTPILMWHFGTAPLLALPMTIALTPVLAFVLATGYVGLALSPVWDAGGGWLIHLAASATGAMDALTAAVDAGAIVNPRVPLTGYAGLVCAASTLGVGVWWLASAGRTDLERTRLRRARTLCTVGVLVWGAASATLSQRLPSEHALRVTIFDVGDGQTALVRSGSAAALVDAGSSWLAAGVRMIPDALRAQGVTAIDLAFISHADIDHFGVLLDVHNAVPVRAVVVGEAFIQTAGARPQGPEAALLSALRADGVRVHTAVSGDAFALGGATLRVLHPPAGADFDQDNDDSLVLLASVETHAGTFSALLPGDVERDAINVLSPALAGARIDAVIVPHHGSGRPYAADFLASIDPSVVLQSTGPRRVAMPIWADLTAATDWYDTPTHGQVDLTVRRDGTVRVRTVTGAPPR